KRDDACVRQAGARRGPGDDDAAAEEDDGVSCFLSIACPPTKLLVRSEFMHDMNPAHAGKYEHGIAHRVLVEPGQVPRFSVLLENGALYYGLPVHALCTKECPPMPLHVAVLWNA